MEFSRPVWLLPVAANRLRGHRTLKNDCRLVAHQLKMDSPGIKREPGGRNIQRTEVGKVHCGFLGIAINAKHDRLALVSAALASFPDAGCMRLRPQHRRET